MKHAGLIVRILRSFLRIAATVLLGLLILWTGLFWYIRRPSMGALSVEDWDRADPQRLEADVRYLAGEIPDRHADNPEAMERAAAYIEARWKAAGVSVESQGFEVRGVRYRNVLAHFGPAEGPRIVVGAHYDVMGLFGDNPGADDNASGTAGVLELGWLLVARQPDLAVTLVAFANEEPPNFASSGMGSAVHAASLRKEGVELRGMICLEMIGYFTDEQEWPNLLYHSLYPNRGDFIGVVGRAEDVGLTRHVKAAFRGSTTLPAYSFTAPRWLGGVDASDHRSYWNERFPAVMITDGSFLRNPHYHTPGDTPETLDFTRMAQVVDGVLASILSLEAGE